MQKQFLKNKWTHFIWACLCLGLLIASGIYIKRDSKELAQLQNNLDNLNTIANAHLVSSLRTYDVYGQDNKLLPLVRHGRSGDGGYVVPEVALTQADVVMGYGIADDISFEEEFSNKYDKPSYGFDCSIENIVIKNKKCQFINQCISSDKFIYNHQQSSRLTTTFPGQLKSLDLGQKKVFVKMDIEGAEYEAFKDIYKYAPQITGIALEIHFDNLAQQLEAVHLINRLNHDFYLVHVHCNNCCGSKKMFTSPNATGKIASVLELTFINKSLVHRASISADQSHPKAMDMPNCPQIEDANFTITEQ